ncbi:cupin-like domain-containing protein [Marinobacter sp. M216]|uniref:Cupin-like domain-containing protein n=1 Tax=Marinobacter albus TaxID=3030833 RepID=A0ABT7HDP8_9GAMM|nr:MULTISPECIES: cupin-like domain-containing protein [unclassified Marinobacter]MBW7470101.1 cupin-like domain-containing protein [Marinobacter sp. F4218]MDK9557635.1 cupin-like domain-containing protein [Marinobacter sp. M216]
MPVTHDCHLDPCCTDSGIAKILETIPLESIKAKPPAQKRHERVYTNNIPRSELLKLLEDPDGDVWIALHEIEDTPILRHVFREMASALRESLPAPYGKVTLCTGSLFISRGQATTPYHLDYGSNLLLQLRGSKHFLAFSPNDPELVPKQSLQEFFGGECNPPSLKYRPSFDQKALILDLEPGMGLYMPSTSPHCTETRTRELSLTISLSFVAPRVDVLRRSILFDARLPDFTFVPVAMKCAVVAFYENLLHALGGNEPRHKSFKPLAH